VLASPQAMASVQEVSVQEFSVVASVVSVQEFLVVVAPRISLTERTTSHHDDCIDQIRHQYTPGFHTHPYCRRLGTLVHLGMYRIHPSHQPFPR